MFTKFNRNPWRWLALVLCLALPTGLIWGSALGKIARRAVSTTQPDAARPTKKSNPATPAKPAAHTAASALTTTAPVQSGGSYNIVKSVVPGGGGESAAGSYDLAGSAGQSAVNDSSGGSYSVSSGFWPNGACPAIIVSPATLPAGTVGQPYAQMFTQSGGTGAIVWSLTGTLPTGLSFTAATATLAGTPLQAGTFSFSVTATDANNCTGSTSYNLTINCQTITVTPLSLPNGQLGQPYSQPLMQSGGVGTIVWSVGAGALPANVLLNPATGLLSGTPTASGTFNFTVRATDANSCFGERPYTVIISTCPVITITPATLPGGLVGTAYNQMLMASGGTPPYTFTLDAGVLPHGLNLATGGLLSGTPLTAGAYNFTIKVTDNAGCMATRSYTVVICTTITVNPATLPNGFVGTAYNQTFTATDGMGKILPTKRAETWADELFKVDGSTCAVITWSVSAGTLPTGLTLSSLGELSGTPTATGTFNFTIRATDTNNCFGERAYIVIISGNGLQFYPLPAPVRLLDTRLGASPNACSQPNAPITGGTVRTQTGRNFCTIPANAAALTGNVTTVESGGGFLTLYPSDATRPTVASTNYAANETINNVFTVGLGLVDGAFNIFAYNTTEVVVDVTGYYAPPATNGLFFHPLPAPVRLLETRPGEAGCVTPGAPLGGLTETTQQARSACTGIPAAARAIVGNATTVGPEGTGFLTLFPGDAARPLVAASNYNTGQTVNGPFSVGLAPNGEFKIYTYSTTHLVVDVLGYYSPEVNDANGAGLLLTPLAHPVRLLETRPGEPVGCFKPGAPLNGQQEYTQAARGTCDSLTIPANALGVVGNATVVGPSGPGFLTLWPSTATRPLVATSNYNPGDVGNRHFMVGLGQMDGAFKLYTYATTHLVVDLAGYFAP